MVFDSPQSHKFKSIFFSQISDGPYL